MKFKFPLCKPEGEFELKNDFLRKSFLSHDSPHLIDIGQGVEVLIIVVIEGTLQSHLIYTVLLRAESQKFGQPKLEAVHFL